MNIFKKLGFLCYYILPILIVSGYFLGGLWYFSAFVFAYFIVPALDEFVGRDSQNVAKENFDQVAEDRYFDAILYAMVYVQVALVVFSAYLISLQTLTWIEITGLLLSMMTFSSGGINVGHELGHKKSKTARFHAKLILMVSFYMHFYIEHNRGHHVNVATPLDPATSRKGQTFYAFWVQTVFGGFKHAWELEISRLQRNQSSIWNPIHNEMLRFIAFPILFFGFLTFIFSYPQGEIVWMIPAFLLLQAFLAFSSLEAVNYIEHYGIERREISPNKYEKVNPLHSWNSNYLISNFFLFQLQRHSDHHAYASRPYQVLRHFDESPQLPFGYPIMIMTALVPPLWFKMMDNRLEKWKAKAVDAEHIRQVVQATV